MQSLRSNIHRGYRDARFPRFLRYLLRLSRLPEPDIDRILTDAHVARYAAVFTHPSVDPENNYEIWELLGDGTLNKAIVWYFFDRFPLLRCPEGVKVIARLKINWVSRKAFAAFGERFHFQSFITAEREFLVDEEYDAVLENVFEAFFGLTEYLVNLEMGRNVGYHVCDCLLRRIFDTVPVSIVYEDLYDPKTRLKELFDTFRELGTIQYASERVPPTDNSPNPSQRWHTNIWQRIPNARPIALESAYGASKMESQQNASALAIDVLRMRGYQRAVPEFYQMLQNEVNASVRE